MERSCVQERSCYKFGILYMKPGQEKDENLVYSNGVPSHFSLLTIF